MPPSRSAFLVFVRMGPGNSFHDEATIINSLFDEGLEIFHLRKPGLDISETDKLMEKIQPQFHTRLAIHQHHSMASKYGIKRLHYTEAARNTTDTQTLFQLKNSGYSLSTSIHQVNDYENISSCFMYTFFGPVFHSISKQGYHSTVKDDFVFPLLPNRPSVIAIGGIDEGNIKKAIAMKFTGVAVLGALWQQPDKAVEQFKALQITWKQAGR